LRIAKLNISFNLDTIITEYCLERYLKLKFKKTINKKISTKNARDTNLQKKYAPTKSKKKMSVRVDLAKYFSQLTSVHNLNHIQNLGWYFSTFFKKKKYLVNPYFQHF
jgi:hypothetical protein